jgi:hypothetical protein
VSVWICEGVSRKCLKWSAGTGRSRNQESPSLRWRDRGQGDSSPSSSLEQDRSRCFGCVCARTCWEMECGVRLESETTDSLVEPHFRSDRRALSGCRTLPRTIFLRLLSDNTSAWIPIENRAIGFHNRAGGFFWTVSLRTPLDFRHARMVSLSLPEHLSKDEHLNRPSF